jgi:cellulase
MKIALIFGIVLGHIQLFRVGGSEKCIRPTGAPRGQRNFPIKDINSQDMVCGAGPTQLASESCGVDAGSNLQLIWGHNAPQDDVVDPSHSGPCNVYLVPGERTQQPPRSGWFKIFEGIWDPVNKWCVDKLIRDRGVMTVPIPQGLRAGNYILRAEINALQESDVAFSRNAARGSQFYIFCADIAVRGGGNAIAAQQDTVSIPGYLNDNSPGVVFNVFGQGLPKSEAGQRYPTLGPQVANLQAGAAPTSEESEERPQEQPQEQTTPRPSSNSGGQGVRTITVTRTVGCEATPRSGRSFRY